MKKLHHIVLSLAIVIVMPAALRASQQDTLPRKKVAVVLSGGGAKGVAHIGALKVIEEAGIPIDIVVGTSMGAIVGGLYSIGYTPAQLEKMIMAQNWGLLMSDRTERRRQPYSQKENEDKYQVSFPFGKKLEAAGGLIKGTNLEMLFNDLVAYYHAPMDFHTLPIPFACVATNIVDGSAVVMHEGVLPVAMRASMAIPGVFTPVDMGDMLLVDGGVVNNFPANVARDMGADVIIGVDVQSPLKEKDQLVGAPAILGQIIELAMQQQTYRRNVRMTDVYVQVDVKGYTTASFNLPALDSLMQRGRESANARWDDLVRLRRGLGLHDEHTLPERERFLPLSEQGRFHVYDILFEGLSTRERRWVMRKCRLREDSEIDMAKLERCMSVIGATTSHSNIYYSLRDTVGGYNLDFHMDQVKGNSINAGVSFDSEEIASVLVNGTFRLPGRMPMVASATGRFGKRLMVQLDYSFLTSPLSSFKLGYTFRHNDINIYSAGKRYYNPTYNHHLASFSFVNMNFLRQNLRLELGLEYQKFSYLSWLTGYRDFEAEGDMEYEKNLMAELDKQFVSYFARIDFETLDSRYFARRGTAVSLAYDLYTDNFLQYEGSAPFAALSMSWMTAFPLSGRFSLIPSVYGRVLMGNDIPFTMRNMVGGKFFGRYMPQQMPFDGIRYIETMPHTFLATKLQARQRVNRRHYVSASFNYGIAYNDIFNLVYGKNYFGASVDYGYDLRSFPIMVSLGWSNITRSVGFYFQAGYVF